MRFQKSRVLDLSVSLAPSCSESVPVEIEYMDHEFGGGHLAELVGIDRSDLPEGLGWASERISAITHSGTHVDSPFHYSPRCDGNLSATIDAIPLEWFWGPGVCIPVVDQPQEKPVEIEEVRYFEDRWKYSIAPDDIVLFWTGADEYYGSIEYKERGRGISPGVIELLCSRGVRVFGTDAWSIDPPYRLMRENIKKRGPGAAWEGHFVGRSKGFCAIEKLTNLKSLPPFGFWVGCFPIKVKKGSAGWTRAVAFLDPAEQNAN